MCSLGKTAVTAAVTATSTATSTNSLLRTVYSILDRSPEHLIDQVRQEKGAGAGGAERSRNVRR